MLSFFTPRIYVQLSPQLLTIRNVRTGVVVSEIPEIALEKSPKERVLAVGAKAHAYKGRPSVDVVNPFAHPRCLLSDFTLAEQVLSSFMARVHVKGFWPSAPMVIMHPQGDPEGGFTQIERRALRELAMCTGAFKSTLWLGQPLTDQDVRSNPFKDD